MNNVITILIDSLTWDCTNKNKNNISATPFLDSLKSNSIITNNMYSQGPYTDAATKSLYTFDDCLNSYGYFFKLNKSSTNHYKTFKENGYETYGCYYPYYLIGENIKNSIDHVIYNSGFLFSSEWGGIFDYYKNILEKRPLTKTEINLLVDRIDLMFKVWIDFYKDCINKSETIELIKDKISDVDSKLSLLENKYKDFINDKNGFIKYILSDEGYNFFINIDNTENDANTNKYFINEKLLKSKLLKKIKLYTVISNILYNTPSPKRLFFSIKGLIKNKDHSGLYYLINYYNCFNTVNRFKSNVMNKDWQVIPSAKKQLDYAKNIINSRKQDKPFYYSIHLEDCHDLLSFFSYDIESDNLLNNEFSLLENFVKEAKFKFKGDLLYLLSIRYTDYCIEHFIKSLNKDVLNNTTFLIVADHGSPFGYNPIHNKMVNCFDTENYHIPMIIYNNSYKQKIINDYCSSFNVFPTLFDLVGINDKNAKSKSLLSNNFSNDYVITEYMGPGCPDMINRRIWFSARDDRYIVAYKVGIYENFEDGEIVEIYDNQKDPNQFYNIKDRIDLANIDYLLKKIENRFNEIQKNTNTFLSNY